MVEPRCDVRQAEANRVVVDERLGMAGIFFKNHSLMYDKSSARAALPPQSAGGE
jgi:hypothetical protein